MNPMTTVENYKNQAHPVAAYRGQITDDIYDIVREHALSSGAGTFDNGGEFDPDYPDRLVFMLHPDDHSSSTLFLLSGQIDEAGVLQLESIELFTPTSV